MCSWRLLPRVRPLKKVLFIFLSSVAQTPDSLSSLPLTRSCAVYPHLNTRATFPMLPHMNQIAGVRGTINRYVITIPSPSATYHFYEMDVVGLEQDWPEKKERKREWVDYAEAVRRLEWKTELAQGLKLSSLAPRR